MKKALILLLILFTYSCNSEGDDTMETNDTLEVSVLNRLEIMSLNGVQLDLNGLLSITLTLSGKDQFNQPFPVSSSVVWISNNANISVNQSGTVTALSIGSSVITATDGDVSASITITVIDTTPQPGTYIYVSDTGDFSNPPWKIYRYDEDGQNPVVFIDESQQISQPQDILFLEDRDEVLISNFLSGTISRHNASTGAFINNFTTGLSQPTRLEIGPDNLLYVLQWSGNTLVLRYELDGTFVDQFTNVGVFQSIGMDWGSSGNLYVSSFNNGNGGSIRKFDTNGNDLGIFANTNMTGPTDIWFDTISGNLYANDWSAGRVASFDTNGNFLGNVITGLSEPEGIDYLPNGNLLIGNGGTGAIKMYDSSGNFISDVISSGSGGLVQPNAVVSRTID